MPAQERVRLEDEECILPVLHAIGEEDQPETIGWRKVRLFDLAVKDDELLAQQGILGDEIRFAACEVSRGTEHNRLMGGASKIQESLFKERNDTKDELDLSMEEGQHGV